MRTDGLISFYDLAWLAAVALLANHWWRSRHAKSLALHMAWKHCREQELQLLDHSVALERTRLQRGEDGRLQWRRHYQFEFSSTGQERRKGSLVMAGNRLLLIDTGDHVTWSGRREEQEE